MSDEKTRLQTFQEYGLRFDIEEAFRDDQSNGWNLQKSEIRSVCDLSRLFLILAVATLYVTAQGVAAMEEGRRKREDGEKGNLGATKKHLKTDSFFLLPPVLRKREDRRGKREEKAELNAESNCWHHLFLPSSALRSPSSAAFSTIPKLTPRWKREEGREKTEKKAILALQKSI